MTTVIIKNDNAHWEILKQPCFTTVGSHVVFISGFSYHPVILRRSRSPQTRNILLFNPRCLWTFVENKKRKSFWKKKLFKRLNCLFTDHNWPRFAVTCNASAFPMQRASEDNTETSISRDSRTFPTERPCVDRGPFNRNRWFKSSFQTETPNPLRKLFVLIPKTSVFLRFG